MRKFLLVALAAVALAGAGADAGGGVEIATAALKAQDHGQNQKAIALYTKALAAGGMTPQEQSIVYANRGNAYQASGKSKLAFADYAQAIALDPTDYDAYNDRGVAYAQIGQYDLALADYNTAISLNSYTRDPVQNRAFDYFYLGRFGDAAADFKHVVDNPEVRTVPGFGAMFVVQLYLSEARAGKADKDELGRNEVGLDLKAWPAPAMDYFLGKISEADFRRDAAEVKRKEHATAACQLSYYLGEQRLIAGTPDQAKPFFVAATGKACVPDSFLYKSAETELARLP